MLIGDWQLYAIGFALIQILIWVVLGLFVLSNVIAAVAGLYFTFWREGNYVPFLNYRPRDWAIFLWLSPALLIIHLIEVAYLGYKYRNFKA